MHNNPLARMVSLAATAALLAGASACVDDATDDDVVVIGDDGDAGGVTATLRHAFTNVAVSFRSGWSTGNDWVLTTGSDGKVRLSATYTSSPAFFWLVRPSTQDPGYWTIENSSGTLCLDVPLADASTPGTDLQMFACHRGNNQQFAFRSTPAGWKIQPKLGVPNNLCLDIRGGQRTAGAVLQQFGCWSSDEPNQRFGVFRRIQEWRTDCDENLRLSWSGNGTPGAITLTAGQIINMDATSVSMWCSDDPADWTGTPDDRFVNINARILEVRRNLLASDGTLTTGVLVRAYN